MSVDTVIRHSALALAVTAVSTLLLAVQPQAQTSRSSTAAASQVMRITANGSDGDSSYYAVRCADGSFGDVRVEHERKRTCAVAARSEPTCRAGWTIQRAADHVCTAGGR